MRLGFLELPADERRLYIEQAAIQRNVSPVMYLSEPTPFDDILATLADLENRINHAGGGS